MREKLAGLQQEQREQQTGAAWMEHYRIVRGNPVRTYEGERFLLKERKDGDAGQAALSGSTEEIIRESSYKDRTKERMCRIVRDTF